MVGRAPGVRVALADGLHLGWLAQGEIAL
jgi:hypothetical protein